MSKNGAIWACILSVPLVVILVSGWLIFSGPEIQNPSAITRPDPPTTEVEIQLKAEEVEYWASCYYDTPINVELNGDVSPYKGESVEKVSLPVVGEQKLGITFDEGDTDSISCHVKIFDPSSKKEVYSEPVKSRRTLAFTFTSGSHEEQLVLEDRRSKEKLEQERRELRAKTPASPEITCDGVRVDSLSAARETCGGRAKVRIDGAAFNKQQEEAVNTAYGVSPLGLTRGPDHLAMLYKKCTESRFEKVADSEYELKTYQGALVLCPEHPDAESVKKAERQIKEETVKPGSHIIGTDMKPGRYETNDSTVQDCYWELSDAQGNTIENKFVNVAGKLTVDTNGAYGFTSQGCGDWRLVK